MATTHALVFALTLMLIAVTVVATKRLDALNQRLGVLEVITADSISEPQPLEPLIAWEQDI